MIFYILAGFNFALTWALIPCLVYYRHNPMIANRDYPLIILSAAVWSINGILHAVGYELYFDDYPGWGVACRYIISWPTLLQVCLTTVPTVCRAYNIQFKFYLNQEKVKMNADFYYKYRHTATLKYNFAAIITIFFVYNIPSLISYLLVPFPTDPQNVTQCFSYFTYILVAQGIPLSCCLNYLFLKFWPLRDPYHIKVEFGWQFATGFTLFCGWIVIQLYDTITGGVNFPDQFHPMYLMSLFAFNITFCNLAYPVYLAYRESKLDLGITDHHSTHSNGSGNESPFHNKVGNSEKSNKRLSGEVTVKAILENDELYSAFRDITVQYWCVESLLFIVAVENYKKKLESERETEAIKIFKLFFDPESHLFVNLPDRESKKVADLIKQKNFSVNLFEGCFRDVQSQLEGILMRWKTTSEYKTVFAHSNFAATKAARRASSSAQMKLDDLNIKIEES